MIPGIKYLVCFQMFPNVGSKNTKPLDFSYRCSSPFICLVSLVFLSFLFFFFFVFFFFHLGRLGDVHLFTRIIDA